MLIEAEVSYKMGYLSKNDLYTHYEILSKVNIKPNLPSGITVANLMNYIKQDNKRGYITTDDNQIGVILLERLGVVHGNKDLPITLVPIKIIEEVLGKFVNTK